MLDTFIEFTFEGAHRIPPYSGLHGHSFTVVVYLKGKPDPVFGWTHNLYEVEASIAETKQRLHDCYLNDIEGLEVPTLENVAAWIWHRLDKILPGLDRVQIRRGMGGSGEGCCYSGRRLESPR